MNHKEFGQLIAALRKEHFDEDGNRLTQAKLAERAQQRDPHSPLNEIIIGKIERGERAMLDEQTLLSLADTLELTMGERREFFLAATGLDNEQLYPVQKSAAEMLASVIHMLADIQLPALLVDNYLDVIAANAILVKLYDTNQIDLRSRMNQPAGFNLLSFIFSADFEPHRQLMTQREWNNFAVSNVIYFRRVTLRCRMTDYFAALLAQLQRSREFRWFWEQVFYEEKRYFVGGESFKLGTSGANQFSFLTAPLVTLTPYGNLEIITHIPRNAKTAAAFHQLASDTPPKTYQLSPWPEKTFYKTTEPLKRLTRSG
ncbi:MAG: helix-turn-helix domain-containing protein [Anaerolineae bacterium]|nr:helix-turn-helix domain-containing protein [Anaerolineae bacterium]